MQWSDVTRTASPKTLRQFAGLSLLLFGGLAVWRFSQGRTDATTIVLAVAGFGIGLVGLAVPQAIGPVFRLWMMAAFPIGWAISKIVLAVLFYGLFTPVSLVFRLTQRDALQRRRRKQETYWAPKVKPEDVSAYFRQS
jgi:hypothetical protein